MNVEALLADYGWHLGTFAIAVVSGFVPIVNIELVLLGAASLVPMSEIWLLPLWAALGQMLTKIGMYWGGRGMFALSSAKYQARLEKWQHKFNQSEPKLSLFLFASAFTGLPPFFIISILAGAFRIHFVRFMIIGTVGRVLRFAAVCAFPALARQLFG